MELAAINYNYWILQTIAMLGTALVIPGLKVNGPFGALLTVVALAFFNSKIWDTALFFQIPDTFTTQALALLITNGVFFWILVKIIPGIAIKGFLPALVAPLVFTALSILVSRYFQHVDWLQVFQQLVVWIGELKAQFGSLK